MNVRLIAMTQVRENYGAHGWDGRGECPQYWKNKGGSEYLLATLDLQKVVKLGHDGIVKMVEDARPYVTANSEMFQEEIIDYNLYYGDQKSYWEETYEKYGDTYKMKTLEEMKELDLIFKEEAKARKEQAA